MNKHKGGNTIGVLQLFFIVGVVALAVQQHQQQQSWQRQYSSNVVSAFVVQLQHRHKHRHRHYTPSIHYAPGSTSSFSSSRLLDHRDDEAEFVRMKREKEAAQQEWEEKIAAKNEKKAQRKIGVPETSRKVNGASSKPESTKAAKDDDNGIINNGNKNDNKNHQQKDDEKEDASACTHYVSKDAVTFAQAHSSELIAMAGPKFDDCDALGVGGLDDVVAELKRRVWTPLAAPPSVMAELGISPVKGVLLWGSSGCGKTLLARTIGKLLSPARPLTVVSGPQLMDKFVGSSEKNLRELFDNPSPVYDPYRISGGKGMDTAALHVIVLDEFDAMARTRSGSSSDQKSNSEAGVARDSVVNQILSKMDGVDPLPVPTLVIAMTNRPTLIDPALLRPGRFEVQIEVPPPRTVPQRVAILKVHMDKMRSSGRLMVRDAPANGCVSRASAASQEHTYEELLKHLASLCEGFSGASLAAVPRAAASRALERAMSNYSSDLIDNKNKNNNDDKTENRGVRDAIAMLDCVVSVEDLENAVEDVRRSAATTMLQQQQQQQQQKSTPAIRSRKPTDGFDGDNQATTNGGAPLNGNWELEVLATNGSTAVY